MKARIGIDGIEGQWDIDIPDNHPFVVWASVHSKYNRVGWDTVGAFEGAIRNCITEELTIDILPEIAEKDLPPYYHPAAIEITSPCSRIWNGEPCGCKAFFHFLPDEGRISVRRPRQAWRPQMHNPHCARCGEPLPSNKEISNTAEREKGDRTMNVRIGIDGIEGRWDIGIPDGHPIIAWVRRKRCEAGGMDEEYPLVPTKADSDAIRECIAHELTIDILPEIAEKDLQQGSRIKCPPSVEDIALAIEAINKRLDTMEVNAVKSSIERVAAFEAAHPAAEPETTAGRP